MSVGQRSEEEAPIKQELYRVARLITRVSAALPLSPKFARAELARIRRAVDIADAYLKDEGYEVN